MPSVMIAEDDLFMADMLEEALAANGYDVCGIASTVEKAVELASVTDRISRYWISGWRMVAWARKFLLG